jgi:hypothetical protein
MADEPRDMIGARPGCAPRERPAGRHGRPGSAEEVEPIAVARDATGFFSRVLSAGARGKDHERQLQRERRARTGDRGELDSTRRPRRRPGRPRGGAGRTRSATDGDGEVAEPRRR